MIINQEMTNQATGQIIRFLRTGEETEGQLLEMETVYESFSDEPPSHFHPRQEEVFEIRSGELTIRINSEIRTYKAGERIYIKRGVHHSMWNAGSRPAVVNWKVMPALDTAEFLTTLTILANTGKTNEKGIPAMPMMIYLLNKYRKSFCLSKLNGLVLKFAGMLFYPVYLLGCYRQRVAKSLFRMKLAALK